MSEESIGCVVSWQSEVGFGAFCELYPTPKEAAEAIVEDVLDEYWTGQDDYFDNLSDREKDEKWEAFRREEGISAEAIAAKMELHTYVFGVEHHYKIHCLHK